MCATGGKGPTSTNIQKLKGQYHSKRLTDLSRSLFLTCTMVSSACRYTKLGHRKNMKKCLSQPLDPRGALFAKRSSSHGRSELDPGSEWRPVSTATPGRCFVLGRSFAGRIGPPQKPFRSNLTTQSSSVVCFNMF